jgi:hypothetical protein
MDAPKACLRDGCASLGGYNIRMEITQSSLAAILLAIAIYFVKRLIDKTEKTIGEVISLNAKITELGRIEKRLEAQESILFNLSRDVGRELAAINEALKWLRKG